MLAAGVVVKEETAAQLDDGPMQWKQIDKKKKQRTEVHDKVIGESVDVRATSSRRMWMPS
jgi:hypothetical protein